MVRWIGAVLVFVGVLTVVVAAYEARIRAMEKGADSVRYAFVPRSAYDEVVYGGERPVALFEDPGVWQQRVVGTLPREEGAGAGPAGPAP